MYSRAVTEQLHARSFKNLKAKCYALLLLNVYGMAYLKRPN